MNSNITSIYGNRPRIRVCGLCWQSDKLLVIKHQMEEGRVLWAPPGGGVEYGQCLEKALQQEFLEETCLEIEVNNFRFIAEFLKPPLHAVEIFFNVSVKGGLLKAGIDPEMAPDRQIILQAEYLSWGQLKAISNDEKHGIFKYCKDLTDLKSITGFYSI